jgi:hypothetical protein
MVTSADLNRFIIAAENVLSEYDPVLELPEKDRWAAALYGKKRDHSSALREGICETLVILSVHGNNLFQNRLGIDVESQVKVLIHRILTPLTLEKLLSNNHNLPSFAEAAPDKFIKIIEEDLKSNDPVILGVMKPVDKGSFWASPSRTGLLWALECLAWKPQNLSRVSAILAQLSIQKIDDNWANKPESSLQAIFRSWMPQTAASVEQRIKVLEILIRHFPSVAWRICIEQVKIGSKIGYYSYKPRWRSDASGAGQVATRQDEYNFNRKVLDLLIAWPTHDEKTLGELVESLQDIPEENQLKVWDLINEWSQEASEEAKATLRESIRLFAFTQRGHRRNLGLTTRDRAREAYDSLKPHDPIIRHGWLFTNQWVQESADEINGEDFDYQKREERIDRLRCEAMYEIWTEYGFDGVMKLLASSDAAGTIGCYVESCINVVTQKADFIRRCLSLEGDLRNKTEWCLQGFLGKIKDNIRTKVLQTTAEVLPAEDCKRLFICAPFQESTWRLMDDYSDDIHTGYWKDVLPTLGRYTSIELTELVDCLLEARRPRAAFYAVQMDFKGVETSRLKRLLLDIATVNAEPIDHFKLDSYHLSEALDSLDGRVGVTSEEMAQLEFLFIDALDYSEHGFPNLENQIVQSPALFVQMVALVYKRSDEGEDPLEWKIENPEQRVAVASAIYRLLGQFRKIPGMDENGMIDDKTLIAWLLEVRRLFREYARSNIGDQCLGQLLAKAPMRENGLWPCEAVCEAMEEIASEKIGEGFHIGVYNSCGVQWRGEGGNQERELAAKYRSWATRLHFDYPFVGGVLEDIADTYDREAAREDSETKINKRLHY